MTHFLVRYKVYCPMCKKPLKKGQDIKKAEYHAECLEKTKTNNKETKMKKFKALTGTGSPIITVVAENIEEARKKIHEQFRRPGRFDYFGAWKKGGFKIEEGEIVRGDHYGAINSELLKEKQ